MTTVYKKGLREKGNKVNVWNKIKKFFENNPVNSIYRDFCLDKLSNKKSVLQSSITYCRNGTIQKSNNSSNNEVSMRDPKSIPGLLYENLNSLVLYLNN